MGTFVFVLFGLIVVLTHFARINRQKDDLMDVELPRLAAATEAQLVSYFDLNVRSLRLLADVYDWEAEFSRFAADPDEARRIADSYADALEVRSVDFVDFERRLVHAYWSADPIQLDAQRERDRWFFETWDVPDPPETQVTLYYDQDMGGNAVYTDHLLRSAEGAPVGIVGILTDVATLAQHMQRILIEDESFFLLGASGKPMVKVGYESFQEFGPVYDLDGRNDRNAAISMPDDTDTGFLSQTMPIPQVEAEGIVFLNIERRLHDIRLTVFSQMAILLIAYVVLVGSYIALMAMHAGRIRAHAAVIQDHRERLDDIISVLTHNLSNDLHALRQRLSLLERQAEPISVGYGGTMDRFERAEDRSSDVILMDMEQVLQNAIYSSQLGSTAVRSTVRETTAEELLQRLHEACNVAAMAKGQHLQTINRSAQAVNTDQDLLFHVLFNMVGNAIKFSPPGATIVCGAWDEPESVALFVVDQGPGFSPEDRAQLFQKHRRLSARPTSGERSTGMGLYVARRLADTVGATITLCEETPAELRSLVDDLGRLGAVWLIRIPAEASPAI